MTDKTIGDLDPITMPLYNGDKLEVETGSGSQHVTMRNLAGMARVSWARPAANPITVASDHYASFDEPWFVEADVNASDGEMVLVRCYCAPSTATDVFRGLGLEKNGALVIKNITYPGGKGNGHVSMEYLDESPSDGVNTYEVVGAANLGATMNIYTDPPNDVFQYNGENNAGPALLIAQILVPLYDNSPPG